MASGEWELVGRRHSPAMDTTEPSGWPHFRDTTRHSPQVRIGTSFMAQCGTGTMTGYKTYFVAQTEQFAVD